MCRYPVEVRLSLRVLCGLADVLGQSPDETGQLRHAPEERLVVVASLIWPRRVEALEVPRRKLPREALVLATDEKSRDDITYEFLSL